MPKKLNNIPEDLHEPLMAQVSSSFPQGNPEGVIGADIGPKMQGGRAGKKDVLRLFVRAKVTDPAHPISAVTFEHEGQTYEVTPDVVAVGRIRAGQGTGQSIFSGLHAGAAIQTYSDRRVTGAVGCLMGAGAGPSHLLTAGHLFSKSARASTPVWAGWPGDPTPVQIGTFVTNLLLCAEPHDAALVELNAAGRQMAAQTQSPPWNFRRIYPAAEAPGAEVQCYQPTCWSLSQVTSQGFSNNFYDVEAELWPDGYRVRDVVRTDLPIALPGDSGCPLLSLEQADTTRYGLGSCIGGLGAYGTLFEPLSEISEALSDLGFQLSVVV